MVYPYLTYRTAWLVMFYLVFCTSWSGSSPTWVGVWQESFP